MSDKSKVVFVGTIFAWCIIVAFVTWVFLAVGWYLLFLLWKKELLIPANVQNTSIIIFLVLIWALFVLIFSVFLEKKYCAKKNRRKKIPFLKEKKLSKIQKPEAQVLINSENDSTHKIYWRGDVSRKKKIKGTPEELLSQAKIFNLENSPREAASLARLIMHSKVSNKIEEEAAYELITALKNIGYTIKKD